MHDFVISDTHWFHARIAEYAGRPEEHNQLMLERWRETVGEDQTVLHLGDVVMGYHALWPTLGALPGKVEVLDSGNHDEAHKRSFLERERGWKFIPEFKIEYRGWTVCFTHAPLWVVYPNPADNTEVDLGPHSEEDLASAKLLNVHGHIHQKPDPSRFHINVAVERIDYRPVKLQELLDQRLDALGA